MKNISKIATGTIISGVLTLGLISSVLAAPLNSPELQPKDFQVQHEAMIQVMDQGYDAWVNFVSQNAPDKGQEMLKVINETNFPKFQESHKLMEQAHDLMTQAEAINKDLGLPQREHGFGAEGRGMFGHGKGRGMMNPEVMTAIQNKDFAAWQTAVEASPMKDTMSQYINEGNFSTFSDMMTAMKNGDKATADSLRTQLGIPAFEKQHMHGHQDDGLEEDTNFEGTHQKGFFQKIKNKVSGK